MNCLKIFGNFVDLHNKMPDITHIRHLIYSTLWMTIFLLADFAPINFGSIQFTLQSVRPFPTQYLCQCADLRCGEGEKLSAFNNRSEYPAILNRS